mgnify:FL=1
MPGLMAPLLLYLMVILISSWYVNRSLNVALLSVAATVGQFTGYGWGFIYSSCRLL